MPSPSRISLLKAALAAALILGLTAILSIDGLRQSLMFGRLSAPPVFDDVAYFAEAARWIAAFPGRSVAASLFALLHEHAPFATGMAVLGFLAAPDGFLGPYALNAVLIAAFLVGCASLNWKLRPIELATCLVAVAAPPLLTQLLNEARPDLPWGLAMGLVLIAIIYKPLETWSCWRLLYFGMLAGVAAMIKPSAIVASIAFVGGALGIGLICNGCESGENSKWNPAYRHVRSAAIFLAGFCGVVLLLVAPTYRTLASYLLATLVYNKNFWVYEGNSFQQALFYWETAKLVFGPWLKIGIVLAIARLTISYFFDRKDFHRAWAVCALLVWVYLVPSLSDVKTLFLGATFYGVFLVALAINLASVTRLLDRGSMAVFRDRGSFVANRLLDRFPRGADVIAANRRALSAVFSVPIGALVVVATVFSFEHFRQSVPLVSTYPKSWIDNSVAMVDAVWVTLRDQIVTSDVRLDPKRGAVVAFNSPAPVTPNLIDFYATRQGIRVTTLGLFFDASAELIARRAAASEFAVVSNSQPHPLPGPRMGDEIISRLDLNPDVCPVAVIPQLTGGVVKIYRNRRLGCPAKRLDGTPNVR